MSALAGWGAWSRRSLPCLNRRRQTNSSSTTAITTCPCAGVIDQQKIARVDAGLAHCVAGHAHQERGLRVLDEDVVEVEPRDAGVVRRRPEADGDAGAGGHRASRRVAADSDDISGGWQTTGHASSIARADAESAGHCSQEIRAHFQAHGRRRRRTIVHMLPNTRHAISCARCNVIGAGPATAARTEHRRRQARQAATRCRCGATSSPIAPRLQAVEQAHPAGFENRLAA